MKSLFVMFLFCLFAVGYAPVSEAVEYIGGISMAQTPVDAEAGKPFSWGGSMWPFLITFLIALFFRVAIPAIQRFRHYRLSRKKIRILSC